MSEEQKQQKNTERPDGDVDEEQVGQEGSTVYEDLPQIVIEPSTGWVPLNLKELWRYRELLYFLTWRDVMVRYKQTFVGVLWALIKPFVLIVVFTLFFGKFASMEDFTKDIPYAVFTFAGLLPWQLFSSALGKASGSLVANKGLLTKVYFPRLILPLSSVLTALVDFFIAFIILFGLMVYYGVMPDIQIVLLPVFTVIALITALGVGVWFSALQALYRDIGHVIQYVIRLWMFVTPVVYPTDVVPDQLQLLYALNPMVGVVDGFRWCLFGTTKGLTPLMGVSVLMTCIIFVCGLFYFRRMERFFVDVI